MSLINLLVLFDKGVVTPDRVVELRSETLEFLTSLTGLGLCYCRCWRRCWCRCWRCCWRRCWRHSIHSIFSKQI